MSRYAIITHVGSSQKFAILVEGSDGVDAIGISEQGKEWEKWADALPRRSRNTIDMLLPSLGSHLSVQGPAALTKPRQAEFDSLVADNVEREKLPVKPVTVPGGIKPAVSAIEGGTLEVSGKSASRPSIGRSFGSIGGPSHSPRLGTATSDGDDDGVMNEGFPNESPAPPKKIVEALAAKIKQLVAAADEEGDKAQGNKVGRIARQSRSTLLRKNPEFVAAIEEARRAGLGVSEINDMLPPRYQFARKGELHRVAPRLKVEDFSPEEVEQIQTLLDDGVSRPEVAEKFSIAEALVIKFGQVRRPVGDVQLLRNPRQREQRNSAILKDFEAGVTRSELAKKYGLSLDTIRRIVPADRPKLPKDIEEQRDLEIIGRKLDGQEVSQIAEATGLAERTIYGILDRLNMGAGDDKQGMWQARVQAEKLEMIELRSLGESIKDIAEAYGKTESYVRGAISKRRGNRGRQGRADYKPVNEAKNRGRIIAGHKRGQSPSQIAAEVDVKPAVVKEVIRAERQMSPSVQRRADQGDKYGEEARRARQEARQELRRAGSKSLRLIDYIEDYYWSSSISGEDS